MPSQLTCDSVTRACAHHTLLHQPCDKCSIATLQAEKAELKAHLAALSASSAQAVPPPRAPKLHAKPWFLNKSVTPLIDTITGREHAPFIPFSDST